MAGVPRKRGGGGLGGPKRDWEGLRASDRDGESEKNKREKQIEKQKSRKAEGQRSSSRGRRRRVKRRPPRLQLAVARRLQDVRVGPSEDGKGVFAL